MKIACSSFTNIGPRRSNQDRLLVPESTVGSYFVAAIADGIGGAPGGDEAATIATQFASMAGDDPSNLTAVFSKTVAKFRKIAAERPEYAKMGTTLSIALFKDRMVYVAHVGDTRIYHLRGAGIMTLTRDQTEVAELRRRGVLTESQARRYPRQNVLLSALTASNKYEIYRADAKIELGDRFLFVTDGVYQTIMRGGVVKASFSNATISGFVDEVERRVAASEPSDNFSALGIEIIQL